MEKSYNLGTNNPMYARGTTYDSLGDDYQKKRLILQDFIKVEIANNIDVAKSFR